MKKVTIFFDNEHTISVELETDEIERIIEWFGGEEKTYKLETPVRTCYLAKRHIRHITVSK